MTRRPKKPLIKVLIVVAMIAVGIAVYLTIRPKAIEPPDVPTAGLDPAVAKAIETARNAVRAEPKSATAWGELGVVLFAHTLYPESLPCLAEAERLAPTDPHWPYYQAFVYLLDDPVRALECLDRAIAKGGGSIAPRVRRAETLLSLERFDEAKVAFEDVRSRKPDHPRVSLGLARLAARAGEWDRCIALVSPLVDDPSSRRSARGLLAGAAARKGDTVAAAEHQAAVDDLPRDIPWEDPYLDAMQKRQAGLFQRVDFANRLIARKQFAEAEGIAREIIRTDPKAEEAYLVLARIHLAAGDPAEAVADLTQCLAIAPLMPIAHYLLGTARFQLGDFIQAEAAFKRVAELNPEYAAAHFSIGDCRRKQNDARGAATAYREAIRFRPNMVEAHIAAAAALIDVGEPAEARTHVQAALRLKPEHPEALSLLKKTGG